MINSIEKNKKLSTELLYDKHNIQEMINMLNRAESKGEYRTIAATIKRFVKYVEEEKCMISDNVWTGIERNEPRLFEVEAPEIDHREHMLTISSYFGALD